MYEVNEPFNFASANFSELYAEAFRLTNALKEKSDELTTLQNKMMYVERAFANRERQYTQAKDILTAVIESEELDNEEAVKELVEIFGIEILKTVEFTINIEVTGRIEIPMGTELDEYSFNLDSVSYDGNEISVDSENINIERWEFTE
jgi:hypothetical protein